MALVLFATALLVLFRSCPAGQEKVGAAARSAAPALPGWTLHHDENNVWGRARASADSDGIRFLGNFSSWDDCAAAVAAANATRGPFSSSTWYAPGFIHDMRSPFDGNCFAATDTAWKPHINQGVRSARGPSARVPPCADEMDCELNGLCSKITGQCVCHAGWVGETCGVLDLLPVKDPLATAPDGPRAYGTPPTQGGGGLASWGGSVVQDPGKPGLYHLFAAEMSLGCGLHAWFRNSLIRHATASSPRGPFAAQEVVLPAFSHEPVVVALPAGAGFLLYKIGCADNATVGSNSKFTGPCTGCANGTTAGLCPAPDQAYLSTCQDVLFASTLSGPWTRRNLSGFEPSSWDWLHLNSGLESHAPVIMPNGSVLTFTRSYHDPRPAPVSSVWLVSADSWNGTCTSAQLLLSMYVCRIKWPNAR